MTASRRSGALAAALGALACACATPPAGAPPRSAFHADDRRAPIVPDVADHTAADVARAALLSRPDEAERAVRRIEAIDTVLVASDAKPTGLAPAATDLANTTLDDPESYREATRALLDQGGLDPALRARLEMTEQDDPLRLAQERLHEDWFLEFGRAFNSLAEPLGSSVTTLAAAPWRLARSAVGYALALHAREPLPLRQRQALAHWKTFVAQNPEAAESETLEARIRSAEWRLRLTQRNRELRAAETALEGGDYALALVHADRALRETPEDPEADALREEAAEGLLAQRDARRRSLESASAADPAAEPGAQRALAVAMLLPGGDAVGAARTFAAASSGGPFADEARFSHAVAIGELGQEGAMWDELESIAGEDPEQSNMARHAATLVTSPESNPYRAYRRARVSHRLGEAGWVAFGPHAAGPRDRNLPAPLEWLVDLPSMAESLLSMPVRLLELPWKSAERVDRSSARYARSYLARRPDGVHAPELSEWLEKFEKDRGNPLGALPYAEARLAPGDPELETLREEAAQQWLDGASRERDVALRNGMYRELAREMQGTAAAHEAGVRARLEIEQGTPQDVRISRGFLEENPEVAGPEGFDLRPELLDGVASNGELHPNGITLLGGPVVETAYLDPSGDPDRPPREVREERTPEAMARIVSALEESSFRNSLLDADDPIVPDADRDAFFERLRLGLADEVDDRAAARSSYAYRGLRERYGMVRSRESVLPFDLVLRGSLTDMSLGAFPRMRPPPETPDAILYK
jgi:hypothetical protein